MKKWRRVLMGTLGLMVVMLTIVTQTPAGLNPAIAQSPRPSASPSPDLPVPSSTPSISPATPSPPPQVPVTPVPPPPLPPASTAPPLELGGTYQDPNGRFKVGVLKDYKATPFAGSVLVEAADGALAYTVVPQSQPVNSPIGLVAGSNSDLAKVATAVFQRGEAFQPAQPRPEAGGGAVIDWTGTLTIGGKSQPVQGVILVRPSAQNILLLLIAATQAGQDRVPGALSALAGSLESLQ